MIYFRCKTLKITPIYVRYIMKKNLFAFLAAVSLLSSCLLLFSSCDGLNVNEGFNNDDAENPRIEVSADNPGADEDEFIHE